MSVTIKDVAKAAGVSFATVSRALSGSSEISEETKQRIRKISEEMGYTPNSIARSMVKKKTNTIGLVVASVDNPFMSEVANYVEIRARERGYNLMLCNSSYDVHLEREAIDLLIGKQVDGILLIPTGSENRALSEEHINKTPMVYISENLQELPENYVSVDNYRGTKMGTEYLYSMGHRKILYFGSRKNSTTHQLRAAGYKDACKELGIEPAFLNSNFQRSSVQVGHVLAQHLFRKKLEYTAIFAAADALAIGIMQAADEAGIRIPEDVSLLGFDNISFTELPRINLTTIEQPKKAMAEAAVDMLLERIEKPRDGYLHRILSPKLIERTSCKMIDAEEDI